MFSFSAPKNKHSKYGYVHELTVHACAPLLQLLSLHRDILFHWFCWFQFVIKRHAIIGAAV